MWWQRRLWWLCDDHERGASALELALVTPVFLLLIFTFVQAVLLWHGRDVIRAIADHVGREIRACHSRTCGKKNITGNDACNQTPSPPNGYAKEQAEAYWRVLDPGKMVHGIEAGDPAWPSETNTNVVSVTVTGKV